MSFMSPCRRPFQFPVLIKSFLFRNDGKRMRKVIEMENKRNRFQGRLYQLNLPEYNAEFVYWLPGFSFRFLKEQNGKLVSGNKPLNYLLKGRKSEAEKLEELLETQPAVSADSPVWEQMHQLAAKNKKKWIMVQGLAWTVIAVLMASVWWFCTRMSLYFFNRSPFYAILWTLIAVVVFVFAVLLIAAGLAFYRKNSRKTPEEIWDLTDRKIRSQEPEILDEIMHRSDSDDSE